MTNDDRVTRNMSIPAWMVYGAVSLIVVLSAGPIGQVVMLSHHVYENKDQIADTRVKVAAMEVKQTDLVHAIKSLGTEMQELNRSLAVLNSKMP